MSESNPSHSTDDRPGRLRRLIGPIRRVLDRLMLPSWQRRDAAIGECRQRLDNLARRQEELADQVRALGARLAETDAFGWDHVALGRRLAAIEDHLAAGRIEDAREPIEPPRRVA